IDEVTSEERRELMEWITLNRENYELFKSYEKIFDQSALYTRPYNATSAFEKVEERIGQKQMQRSKPSRSLRIVTRKQLAVLFMIPIIISLPYYLNRDAFTGYLQPNGLEMKQYVNPNGKKTVIILPDSTKVTLNGGSSIYFPKQFSAHKRQV